MGRTIDPVCKLCRREGMKLYLKGAKCDTKCTLDRRQGVLPNQVVGEVPFAGTKGGERPGGGLGVGQRHVRAAQDLFHDIAHVLARRAVARLP